ncbi:group 2 family glycosyl transferase [Methylophaga lonarensis MPL]|uniref:Group 2 family glycosyl transferase n=1 Tax=Methylophaga lonarensis MPL TaxID=1286106 RepID=M7PUW3_9GAMM|nr:glycosyltransferase [Methylophaga lonarensis]EMR14239.1 group 2 family glycosyl transferase [Methylophaga lonarensis MPL]
MAIQTPSPELQLSIVIPIFNEQDNIEPLCTEIRTALHAAGLSFEIILVDDASTDNSATKIQAMSSPDIRGVFHRINAGQSAAVASGFAAAHGQWIGTLDGDIQNDPADLPVMLQKALAEQVDCVTGVRAKRQDTWLRKFSSRVANGFRDWITGDKVSDSGCGVRVVRREAVRELPVFNGLHRFMPTLLRGQGFKVIEHPVNHRPRLHGESKYGVNNRLWRGIYDCFGVRWYLKRAVRSDRLGSSD